MYNRIDMGVRIAGEKAIKDDEFVTLSQLKAGNGIQIVRSNGNVEIMSMGYDGVLQIENVVLEKTEWLNILNVYTYRYYNNAITEDSVVTVIPNNEYKNAVTQAKIYPKVTTIKDYIIIESEQKPDANITVNFSVSGRLYINTSDDDTYRCGETIGGHKIVFLYNDKLYLADKDNNLCFGRVIGLSTQVGTIDEFISIKQENVLYLDGWNLIINNHYYLGNNGNITNTKPSTGITQYIGFAKNGNELQINICKPIRRNN